jgi:hypothetical protein
LLRVLENQKEEMRDAIRVGSKLCSVDNDWLRDSESRSVRRIPVLGQQPFRNCNGDPTEEGQPADHPDGNCRQITDGRKLPLPSGCAHLERFIVDFDMAVNCGGPP